MTKLLEIYKCDVCGNMSQVVHESAGVLSCCDKPMKKIDAGTTDAATEKHVPVIEKKDNGYLVTVGSINHPMEDKHFIEWIELVADGISYKKFLKPGDKPEAFFELSASSVTAYEYCNLHGLWSK